MSILGKAPPYQSTLPTKVSVKACGRNHWLHHQVPNVTAVIWIVAVCKTNCKSQNPGSSIHYRPVVLMAVVVNFSSTSACCSHHCFWVFIFKHFLTVIPKMFWTSQYSFKLFWSSIQKSNSSFNKVSCLKQIMLCVGSYLY